MGLIRATGQRAIQVREQYRLPVFYFLLLGAFAGWQSLYNVHLDGIGFSSMQIGILNAIFISASALVVPFWGMLADRFGNNRVLLLLTSVCAAVVFLIGKTELFPWMVFLITVIAVFHQPGGAVVDGMAAGFVRGDPRFTFGQFRLWSSAGYAAAALAAGYMARQGTEVIFTFSAILFLLLSLFNIVTMPSTPVTGRNLVTFRSFAIFFRNTRLLMFLLIIFFFGIASAPLMQFINLYYRDIGAGESLIGWVFFVQAIPEIPAFILGSKLTRRIGAARMILLAMGVTMLRMFLYGFIVDPLLAMVFSVFHCVTIAFFLLGVVEYVQDRTPGHLRTTGQALIWAFYYGAGVAAGNISLGWLRDTAGMNGAMLAHAAMALVILLVSWLFFRYTNGR